MYQAVSEAAPINVGCGWYWRQFSVGRDALVYSQYRHDNDYSIPGIMAFIFRSRKA